MMKPIAAAMLLLAAGCAPKPSFEEFKEASGEFTADVPAGWRRDGDDDLRRRPAAVMTWIGEVAAEKEGIAVGAMIPISRFQRKDAPPAFRKSALEPTDALFGDGPLPAGAPAAATAFALGGYPARRYRRDFETVLGGGMHETRGPFAMRLEDAVVRTPGAYYVLEYRATAALFDKSYPAYERLIATFRPAAGNSN